MKKLFSKALSLVLTLALLATVFTCIGLTASAASDIIETPANSAKDVYLFNFNGSAKNTRGGALVNVSAADLGLETLKGETISISYNYYLESEATVVNEIYGVDWYVGDHGNVNDDTSSVPYLFAGMGKFSSSYVCPNNGFRYGFMAKGDGPATTYAKLYVWDLKVSYVTYDEEDNDVITPINSNPTNLPSALKNMNANVDVSVVSYKEMFNAQKAWKCTFDNVASDKSGFALNREAISGGAIITFDYYYNTTDADSKIYFQTNGGAFDTYEYDGVVGDHFLIPGVHKLRAEKASGLGGATAKFYAAGVHSGELYIWNIKYTLISGGKKYDRTNLLSPENSLSKATDAANGFIVESGTYGEIMGTREAYCLDYSYLTKDLVSGEAAGHFLSYTLFGKKDLYLSFNYKAVGAPNRTSTAYVALAGGGSVKDANGDNPDSHWLLTDGNEHYFESAKYSMADNNKDAFAFYFAVQSTAKDCNLKIYVWNLVLRFEGGYSTYAAPDINEQTIARNTLENNRPYTECTYADVVNATPAMALDFSTAETEANENGGYKQARQLIAQKTGGADGEVTFSFDYYLANAGENELYLDNVAGGSMADDRTGSAYLLPGRHTYTITGRNFSDFGTPNGGSLIFAYIGLNVESSNAKLYIWNLTCKVAGDVNEYAGNKGIYDAANTLYAGPEVSEISYADVENKGDANNDGATNVLDLIRAKRVSLNSYLAYDKVNLGYAPINAETLVEIKLAVLAK